MINEDNANDDAIEEEIETTRKLRKTKTYKYNAWDDIKDQKVNISFRQLGQVVPVIKQQIRAGLSEINPGFRIMKMNMAKLTRESESESEEELSESEEGYEENRDKPKHSL